MRFLPALLLVALLPVAAAAQDAGVVRGRVVAEATGAPLAGASVAVRAATDSAVVAGGQADGDGAFRVGDLGPGRYRVEATAAGYAPYAGGWVTIAEGAPEVDLGEIRLGFEVRAERPEIVVAPDRDVYALQNMPVASGGTATEALVRAQQPLRAPQPPGPVRAHPRRPGPTAPGVWRARSR